MNYTLIDLCAADWLHSSCHLGKIVFKCPLWAYLSTVQIANFDIDIYSEIMVVVIQLQIIATNHTWQQPVMTVKIYDKCWGRCSGAAGSGAASELQGLRFDPKLWSVILRYSSVGFSHFHQPPRNTLLCVRCNGLGDDFKNPPRFTPELNCFTTAASTSSQYL